MRGWIAVAAVVASGGLWAQQPQVENAKVETHAFSGSIEKQLTQLGAGPYWAGYSEPMTSGRHDDGCWTNNDGWNGRAANAPVRLEGQTTMVVLVRVDAGKVDRMNVTSPDCRLDGGGIPFHWISNVPVGASVAWLKAQALGEKPERALHPLAMHPGGEADAALDDLALGTQRPEELREGAAFWLGQARGAHGVATLKKMMSAEPSLKVREQVIFALSQSKDPGGMAAVMDVARNDAMPQMRSKALFWIAQRAAAKDAQAAISRAIANDPEQSVKEQAVFALKQLPGDQGIPMLIEVAKRNPNPGVRKKAMFWLGQSKDGRALDYFAQVLKER